GVSYARSHKQHNHDESDAKLHTGNHSTTSRTHRQETEMRRAAIQKLQSSLLGWYVKNQRDLPWRRTRDPYRVWLSEIMLQQTRVAAVIPYYERFLERFPDVAAVGRAPEGEILRFWSGLGYYSRARNLQRAALQIVAKHGGELPKT